jgi:hypothetical protein
MAELADRTVARSCKGAHHGLARAPVQHAATASREAEYLR